MLCASSGTPQVLAAVVVFDVAKFAVKR